MKKIQLLLLMLFSSGLVPSRLFAAPSLAPREVTQAGQMTRNKNHDVVHEVFDDLEGEKLISSFFDLEDKYADHETNFRPDYAKLIKKMDKVSFFRHPQGADLLEAAIATQGLTEKEFQKLWHSILQAALLQKWYGQLLVTPDAAKNVHRNLAKPGKVMGIGIGAGAGAGLMIGASGAAGGGGGGAMIGGLIAGALMGTLLSSIIAFQFNAARKRSAAGLKGTIYNLATLVHEYGDHMPTHMRDKIVAALEKVQSTDSITKKSNILQRFYHYARRRSKLTH